MFSNYIIILLGIFLCLAPVMPEGLIFRDRGGQSNIKDVEGYKKAQMRLLGLMGSLFIIIGAIGVFSHSSLFILIIIPVLINAIGMIFIDRKFKRKR